MSSLRIVVASLFVLEFLLLLVNGLPITHPTEPAALIEIGTEAGAMVGGGDFTPPRTRLCVMYNYDLKHDDDWGFREHFPQTVGQLADGTTYGLDLTDCPYGKTCPKRYAPCVLVNLEGDRVNTRGEVMAKFRLSSTYPTPPCLGSMKKGLLGGVKNILGHACTPPFGADSIWTDSKQWTWYNSPNQIPPQAATQQSVTALDALPLPRTRLCVMYNYALKHDDDWGFREHFPQTVGQLADGTTYGLDLTDCPYGKTCPKRYAPCTLVNLEGDRVNTRGEVTSKFKLTDTYPSVPCLGSMKKGLFGGVKNILGHACTPPVGADSIWTDSKQWTWYNSPDQIPLKSGVKVGAAAPGSDSGEACPMPTYTLIEVADRSESSFPQMSAARKAECEKERQAWLKSRAAKGDAKAKLALKTLKATPTLASKAKTPSVAKVAGRKSVPLTKSVPKPVSKAKKPTAAKKAKF